MMPTPRLLTASLVAPVDQAPIPDGFVAWDEHGRITAVGRQADLPADRWGLAVHDFPRSLILPGLVNLHTHLEFTHLPLGTGPLHAWILTLMATTRTWTSQQRLSSAIDGARASLAAGVTCVADLSPTGVSLEAAAALGLRGIFYQEAFGIDDGTAGLARLTARLTDLAPLTGPERQLGIAPHSPYTVSLALWQKLLHLAAREGLPLSTHLAESPAEIAWFQGLPSDVPDFHAQLGLPPYQPPHGHPVHVLAEHGLLSADLLAAHCVHTGPAEHALLRRHDVVAVHCPHSNAQLGVGTAPLPDWEREGLRWGLGTDSAASSGDLDLWTELASPTAHQLALSSEDWLRRLTLVSARHLGLAETIGSLTPGKSADLIVVDSPPYRDPGALGLVPGQPLQVRRTYVSGECRFAGLDRTAT